MHVPRDECDLRVKIGIPTVSELNQREHWAKTHRRRKSQRQAVGLILNTCKRPKLPCDVWLIRISPRKLDVDDNLPSAFKAIRDEVARWLGVDDGGDQVIWRYDQRKGKPGEKAVIIEIYGS